MIGLARLFSVAAALSSLFMANVAHAEAISKWGPNRSASSAEFISAAQACITAMGKHGVSIDRLISQGWELASVEEDGKKVDSKLKIFGNSSSGVVLSGTGKSEGHLSGCMLNSSIDNEEVLSALRKHIVTQLDGMPSQGNALMMSYKTDFGVIILYSEGPIQKPIARMVIFPEQGNLK